MTNTNYTKKSRAAFFAHLEQERREMLSAGMSEADIFRIHFGEFDEKGNIRKDSYSGDYAVWLSERKHIRSDRKYARGTPQSLDAMIQEDCEPAEAFNCIADTDEKIDAEYTLNILTEFQKRCFVEVRLNGKTQSEVALELGVSRESVKQAVLGAVKKLKKYFS